MGTGLLICEICGNLDADNNIGYNDSLDSENSDNNNIGYKHGVNFYHYDGCITPKREYERYDKVYTLLEDHNNGRARLSYQKLGKGTFDFDIFQKHFTIFFEATQKLYDIIYDFDEDNKKHMKLLNTCLKYMY